MQDRIFKGASRPAMIVGIPIVPFILLSGLHIIIAMWLMVFINILATLVVLLILAFEILALRKLSENDAYRLNIFLAWVRNSTFRRNAANWGTHSMSPINYKKRVDEDDEY
ncbi:type IV secretion system protein VirB3 [Advenella incenata]|uniref:Type IV secretion system protein VirB3 n=1 Tax=Advenella incenata TaxID=267800 RepID=A0A4Q7V6K6_9BURK|nr:VirB3 family type IV secretion system protein [Advenella incenata]RZT91177.1 type IV secretion system protein VirB3 [Advenella incenata]